MNAPPPAGTRPQAGGLLCVYYKLHPEHRDAQLAAVREFQRTTGAEDGVQASEVLLRFPVPGQAAAPSGLLTLMETYRITDARHLPALLARLDTAAAGWAPRTEGQRHLEWFQSCAW